MNYNHALAYLCTFQSGKYPKIWQPRLFQGALLTRELQFGDLAKIESVEREFRSIGRSFNFLLRFR